MAALSEGLNIPRDGTYKIGSEALLPYDTKKRWGILFDKGKSPVRLFWKRKKKSSVISL